MKLTIVCQADANAIFRLAIVGSDGIEAKEILEVYSRQR